MSATSRCRITTALGLGLGAVGVGMITVGVKARRDVRATLLRERVTATGGMRRPGTAVEAPRDVRALAEVIRTTTLESVGGRTYAETAPYLDASGGSTYIADDALRDERTGAPVTNPDYELWLSATTLQTALMQAYVGFRVAEFTAAVGAALAGAGIGIVVAGRQYVTR